MRAVRRRTLWVIGALLLAVPPVAAQTTTLLAQHTVTTAGSDCATPTNCSVLPEAALTGATSVGVYVNVGTSGTFNFEATLDGSTWVAVTDDINAASSVTSDAARFFSNPGYRSFRVRASAISGAATITYVRGPAGLRSTASLSGGGGDGAIQDGVSSSIEATVFDLTNSNPLAAQIVDANGDAITSFGGGTQYAVDAALGATPTGTLAVAIRDDALSALTPVEGDGIGLRVDANGALWVIPSGTVTVTGTVTANLSATDNAVLDDIADGIAVTATDLDVQSGGADLATEATLGTMLTSANFAAAFGTAGTADAQVLSVQGIASMTPITVSDGSGALNVICDSGCSGGTQYAEDAVHSTGDTGTLALVVRQDAQSDFAADGDYVPLSVDADGGLRVSIVAGAGSGGTAVADDADFTAGTTSFTPMGGFYQSSVTACTDGDACAAGITTGRAVKVALANADGSLVTYQTDATEDAAEADAVTGPVGLTVRRDTAASSAGTTGDYATLNTDASGRLWTNPGVIGVEDAAETAGGGLAMAGAVVRSSAAGSSATAGDNATVNVDTLGRLWTRNGNPCADHARITTAAISTASSGNVEIVALNGSDLIYVCGYSVVATAATAVQFIYGTGTACGTGETDLTGAWSFAANGGITQANGGVPQFVVPAGNAFCVENSGANAIEGHVTYVRTAAP